MVRSLVFIGMLVLACQASADLTPGPEREVTQRKLDVAAFDQTDARIEGSLAVWVQRDVAANSHEVFGAFVTANGERAGEPFHIGTANIPNDPQNPHPPAIAFGGGRYLVMFEDGRGRFVNVDGTMSDELTLASNARELHAAFNGHVFLVTWLDADRLVYRGTIIGSGFSFDIGPSNRYSDAGLLLADVVALNGGFYAIESIHDIAAKPIGPGYPQIVQAVPIGTDGTVGTPIEIAPATLLVSDLRASPSGNDIRVAWSAGEGYVGIPEHNEVRTALLAGGGLESFSAPGLILQALSGDLLIYGDAQRHFARRAGGVEHALVAPATQSVVDDASGDILIFRGLGELSSVNVPNGGDLYIGKVDGPFTPLVLSPRHQQNPDMASSATGLRLAVWSEYIGKDRRLSVMASRIDATGAALDADGIDLGASTYTPTNPSVASNGTDWLVAWKDRDSVYACRVSQSGQLLDTHPILVTQTLDSDQVLSVVWDGNSYVLAYLDGYWIHGPHFVATVVRVSAGGQMLKQIALTEPGNAGSVSIAAGSDGSLVMWGPGAAMLSRTDTITPIALASSGSIVWNGRDFLVTSFLDYYTLRWQFVSGTGVVSAPFMPSVDQSWSARATPFGDEFLLYRWFSGEVFVELMNDRGAPIDGPVKIPDANAPFQADGNMIIYARTIGDAIPDVSRVFVRVLEGLPVPRRRAAR